LLGNGDGTFRAAQSYAVGTRPVFVAVGDFNGDGVLDLAVANSAYGGSVASSVSVLLGQGDGTFQAAENYIAGSNPASVAAGDFNSDGILDLAIATGDSQGTMLLLLGNGDGTFRTGASYTAGSQQASIAVGDFNNDGHVDLTMAGASGVTLLLGNGDGTFQAAQRYAAGTSPSYVAVGDFNGDGFPDLAVAAGNGTTVLLNAADWGGP
jgi:hypothetical protein